MDKKLINQSVFSQASLRNKIFNLLSSTKKRQQDIVIRRFGLNGKNPETLDSIGKSYGITRERVRQIINSVLGKLRQQNGQAQIVEAIEQVEQILMKNDKIMAHKELVACLLPSPVKSQHEGVLNFILYFASNFSEKKEDRYYRRAWFLKSDNLAWDRAKKVISNFAKILTRTSKPAADKELSQIYQTYYESKLSQETLKNYLKISKEIAQNCFAEWGFTIWGEIVPRGVRDKAFLILKHDAEALHFREITKRINELKIDSRKAFAPTVHNELIKDHRFVLVGRGMYGLKEWGYLAGTVKEVMVKILRGNGKTMPLAELIEKVFEEREVKRTTIMLSLQDSNFFRRLGKDITLVKLVK